MGSYSICKGRADMDSPFKAVIKKLINDFEEVMDNPFLK